MTLDSDASSGAGTDDGTVSDRGMASGVTGAVLGAAADVGGRQAVVKGSGVDSWLGFVLAAVADGLNGGECGCGGCRGCCCNGRWAVEFVVAVVAMEGEVEAEGEAEVGAGAGTGVGTGVDAGAGAGTGAGTAAEADAEAEATAVARTGEVRLRHLSLRSTLVRTPLKTREWRRMAAHLPTPWTRTPASRASTSHGLQRTVLRRSGGRRRLRVLVAGGDAGARARAEGRWWGWSSMGDAGKRGRGAGWRAVEAEAQRASGRASERRHWARGQMDGRRSGANEWSAGGFFLIRRQGHKVRARVATHCGQSAAAA